MVALPLAARLAGSMATLATATPDEASPLISPLLSTPSWLASVLMVTVGAEGPGVGVGVGASVYVSLDVAVTVSPEVPVPLTETWMLSVGEPSSTLPGTPMENVPSGCTVPV